MDFEDVMRKEMERKESWDKIKESKFNKLVQSIGSF